MRMVIQIAQEIEWPGSLVRRRCSLFKNNVHQFLPTHIAMHEQRNQSYTRGCKQ